MENTIQQLCRRVRDRNTSKNSRYKDFLTQEDEKRLKQERMQAAQDSRNAIKGLKIKEARLLVW